MNYWFLYKTDTGEIYGSPYLGEASEWTNIPDGCAAIGPIDTSAGDDTAKAAFAAPNYYRVTDGKLVRKTDAEIQAIIDTQPSPQPSATDILGQQVAALTLENAQLNTTVDTLGTTLAQAQLAIISLQRGTT